MRGIKLNVADFIGQKLYNLTIIAEHPNKVGGTQVVTKCICGESSVFLLSRIRNGSKRSCGCRIEEVKSNFKTHGRFNKQLYYAWSNMKSRCNNPKNIGYSTYGGIGVRVCKEWEDDFLIFCDWAIENGWKPGLQVDKDIKGDGLLYSPETCCIVTPKVNSNNRKNNRIIEINGEKLTVSQISDKYSIRSDVFRRRLNLGWPLHMALTTKSSRSNRMKYMKPEIRYTFGFIDA